jgi:hypothetical protein
MQFHYAQQDMEGMMSYEKGVNILYLHIKLNYI